MSNLALFVQTMALGSDPKSNISTRYRIGSWIQAGVLPSKLVMGLPLYGRTWELEDPNVHRIEARAVGPATGSDETMDYNKIPKFNKENGATVVYDEISVSYSLQRDWRQ
ncbi:hypothetical protein K1719_015493 [Acacia pycnantha]|nr:hypothetical protein K1719_015493 [Acacia pycnantha]